MVAAGVASSADVVSLGAAPSSLAALWQAMRKDRFALAGLIIYAFFLLLAVIGPWIAPHDPLAVMKEGGKWLSNEPPFARFALGTTNMGRDIFSELIWGARPAITVGFSAAFMVVAIGTIIGLQSGYFGGWVDSDPHAPGGHCLQHPLPAFRHRAGGVPPTQPVEHRPGHGLVVLGQHRARHSLRRLW